LAGLGYFFLAAITIYFKTDGGSVAPVWAPNALLLAVILLSPRKEMLGLIAAGVSANFLATELVTSGGATTACYALSNGVEVAIAALGLGSCKDARRLFSEPRAMPEVLLWAGLLAPAISAYPAAFIAWTNESHSFVGTYSRWFLADSLGLLIFTPIFIAVLSGDLARKLAATSMRRQLELTALVTLVALTAVMVFLSGSEILIPIVIAPMTLVAVRGGWLTTMATLAIVAIIAGGATSMGFGPTSLQGGDTILHLYGVQIFIAGLIIVQVPIAAALAERQAMIDRLRESEQSLHMLAARSPLLLLAFDLSGRCTRAMGTTEPLLDRPSSSLVGVQLAHLSEEGQYELKRAHSAALEDVETAYTAEFRTMKRRDAWLEATFRAQFDDAGLCTGTIATIHDVTMRKNQELSLSRTATTDSLTGLLNRAGFRDRLDHALMHAKPGTLSVAVIDIDRFKLINDNSGHQVGDVVLREIAVRISSLVRASDAVGRMGGDEFVILLSTSNWERVQEICTRIVSAVGSEPITLPSGNSIRAAISCGVARYREGLSADEFIHEADTALYQAKRSGRNQMVAA
jgi:diguanylate cyclase (GGDEF)-like protein